MPTASSTIEDHTPRAGWGVVNILWPIAVSAAVGLLMLLEVAPRLGGYQAKILILVGIHIILAVSLTVVNGLAGQFSLGHAGFMAVGGYAAAAIVYYASLRLWGTSEVLPSLLADSGRAGGEAPIFSRGDLLFVGGCLIGGGIAAVVGYLVGLPSLRLRGDYLAIVTLGFGEIVRVLLQGTSDQIQFWKAAEIGDVPVQELVWKLGGALGFNYLPTYSSAFWVYFAVTLTLILIYRLKYSTTGRELISIREDEVAAQAMGVNVTKLKVRSFVIAAFFAGVAGGLHAMHVGAINATELDFRKSIEIVIIVVLGGMGSISGAALAAILLTIIPELLRDPPAVWPLGLAILVVMAVRQRLLLDWKPKRLLVVVIATLLLEGGRRLALAHDVNLADYRLIIYSLMLILVMLLRPDGLFGVHEIWELVRWPRRRSEAASPPAGEIT